MIHASTHDFMVNVLKSALKASCTTKGENICNHQIKNARNCNFNLVLWLPYFGLVSSINNSVVSTIGFSPGVVVLLGWILLLWFLLLLVFNCSAHTGLKQI